MKTLTITLSDKAYKRLKSDIMTAALCYGSGGAATRDRFLFELMHQTDNPEDARILYSKDDPERTENGTT